MDKKIATILLDGFVRQLRTTPYKDLCGLLRNPQCKEVSGPDGKPYQVEWEAFWDDPREQGGALRVIVSIDDGTFFASLSPFSTSFILTPDGTFVGE
jgi:hypothetical protein